MTKNEFKKDNDIEDEINALKKNNHAKIWFNFDTGTPGIIFIRINNIFKNEFCI